jgi:low temperature requirement protein LtrA
MQARDTGEDHRTATPLELFFDLCFVVAVAQAAGSLHHELAEGHVGDALVRYPMVFFAVWWAWMNVTWFASAYDNDDVPYRAAVLVQIAGVLILAAGVPRAFEGDEFGVVTLGYAVMRVALVWQWLRAARDDPERAPSTRRYAVGVAVCMVGWGLLLLVPAGWLGAGFVFMAVAELAVPVWAERPAVTTWHPRHIAERYGLFTLIVLGESVLAVTVAVQSALDAGGGVGVLLEIAGGGLLIVFAMWWLYFSQPTEDAMDRARSSFGVTSSPSFVWGYGHLVVFASAAAVGAGGAVAVDQATHHAELSARGATAAVAVPVALYLLSVWVLHARLWPGRGARALLMPAAAVVVLLAILTESVLAIGVVLVLLVVAKVAVEPERRDAGQLDEPLDADEPPADGRRLV